LGGPNSFGAGGWTNTELEAAMPVDFQVKAAKVSAVGALALLMHASEMPEVARGGPVPSAGRIVKLRSNGALYAGIEFTARALAHIKAKEYRFVSPAIAWGMKDKATGEDQGTTLTSLALTNRPFLEELPPIKLSEITPGDSGLEVRRGEKTMPTAQSELIKLTQAKMKSEGKTFSEALISVAKERPELCAEARHEILEERPVFEPPREEEKVEPGPAQARFIALAKSKMANEHISFSEAFNIVCREQPLLASDYREEVIGAKF